MRVFLRTCLKLPFGIVYPTEQLDGGTVMPLSRIAVQGRLVEQRQLIRYVAALLQILSGDVGLHEYQHDRFPALLYYNFYLNALSFRSPAICLSRELDRQFSGFQAPYSDEDYPYMQLTQKRIAKCSRPSACNCFTMSGPNILSTTYFTSWMLWTYGPSYVRQQNTNWPFSLLVSITPKVARMEDSMSPFADKFSGEGRMLSNSRTLSVW